MRFKAVSISLLFPLFVTCPTYAGFFCKDRLSLAQSSEPYVSKAVRKNSFVTGRDLRDYVWGFVQGFKDSVEALKPTDVWVDLGGGKGKALEDYILTRKKISEAAQVVLITYKLGRWFGIPDYFGKLKVLKGRLLEQIPREEIPKAKLMTDYFGVLSYTRDLTDALNIIFDRLEVDGELYIHSSNVHTTIDNPDTINPMQKVISFSTMLESIPGIKVEGRYGTLKITKISEEVLVPDLVLIKIDETTKPPARRFVFKSQLGRQVAN